MFTTQSQVSFHHHLSPLTLFYLPPLPFPSVDHHTVLCVYEVFRTLYIWIIHLFIHWWISLDIFFFFCLCIYFYPHLRTIFIAFYLFLSFIVFFLHYHLTPLYSPLPHCSHHIVVCVHESFFFFAAPLHPLTSCHSCQSALCLWVCLYFPC